MTPLFAGGPVRMFRLSNAPGERGLSCTPDGVALAGVPLMRKTQAGFEPRPVNEIASLFKAAFGERPMALPSRLGTIAKALNSGDFALAMIAAVHTQTPELTAEAAARLARADQDLTKYDYNPEESRDWHGRWTGDGSSAPAAPITPAVDADQRTARADIPPLRVAENTLPSDGAVALDAPAPCGGNTSGAAAPSSDSGKQTALLESFKEKYDGLGPKDFSDQAIRFGYWLEAHGRELTGEERERALAEYFFLEDRLRLRQSDENNSALEHGYLYSAILMLHRGGAASGLVPVGHFPPSILNVAGTIALLDDARSPGLRPATRSLPEEPPAAPTNVQSITTRPTASERAAQLAEEGLSDIQRERFVTLAVTETKEGVRVVSSSSKKLEDTIAELLQNDEIAGLGIGHAEVTGVEAAIALGLTPMGVAASRAICPSCAEYLRERGVAPLSVLRR
jgi:hypothetical protein